MSFTQNFTDKTNDIISAAQNLAIENSHVQLTPIHVAVALFTDADGLAKSICTKAGVDGQVVERNLRKLLVRLPAQEPAPTEVQPNPALIKVLRNAVEIQKKQGDNHTAVDHVLLALAQDPDVGKAFRYLIILNTSDTF